MSVLVASLSEADATDCVANLAKGDRVQIRSIAPALNPEQTILRDRLEELGFLPGESLRVVAVSFPGGDPVAVRLGNTTFALRRHEAEMICVSRQA